MMIKHFCKSFTILMTSWSLLLFHSTVGAGESNPNGVNTTDSNGVITNTKTYEFDKVTDADMLASLGMLAGGFVTGRMLATYTPKTSDVMVAAAGGVAFIAGEIMSNVKFRGTLKKMEMEISRTNDGQVNEEQIKKLEELRKSYVEAKKATATKKKLQLAAAAAFGTAAIMAQFFSKKEFELARACDMAITQNVAALAVCPESVNASPTSAAFKTACSLCSGKISALKGQMKVVEAKRETTVSSSLGERAFLVPDQEKLLADIELGCDPVVTGGPTVKTASTTVKTACAPVIVANDKNQTSGSLQSFLQSLFSFSSKDFLYRDLLFLGSPQIVYEDLQSRENGQDFFFRKALQWLLPTAEAGSWMPLLGLGGSTAASFYLINKTTAVSVDRWMFVPSHRAIAFTGLTGLAFLASKSSDHVMSKIDDNIKRIDKILEDMSRLQKGVKMGTLNEKGIILRTIPNAAQDYQSFSVNNVAKTPCLTSNDSANCNPASDQLKSLPSFTSLPDSLKDTALQAVKMGDGLSGTAGITGSVLSDIDSLASKQAAIANALKKIDAQSRKLANQKSDSGKKVESFLNDLNGQNKKELQKKGLTASGLMASLGTTPLDSSQAEQEKNLPDLKEATIVASIPVNNAEVRKDPKMDDFNLKFNEAAKEPVSEVKDNLTPPVDYEMEKAGISSDTGPSLFELITSRYFKSGYPKLLEEEPSKN